MFYFKTAVSNSDSVSDYILIRFVSLECISESLIMEKKQPCKVKSGAHHYVSVQLL